MVLGTVPPSSRILSYSVTIAAVKAGNDELGLLTPSHPEESSEHPGMRKISTPGLILSGSLEISEVEERSSGMQEKETQQGNALELTLFPAVAFHLFNQQTLMFGEAVQAAQEMSHECLPPVCQRISITLALSF